MSKGKIFLSLCEKSKNGCFFEKKREKLLLFWEIILILHRIWRNADCGNSSVGRARPCQGRGRGSESRFPLECPGGGMVDAHVSGACVERCAGSSPVLGTMEFEITRRDGGIGRRATLRG